LVPEKPMVWLLDRSVLISTSDRPVPFSKQNA